MGKDKSCKWASIGPRESKPVRWKKSRLALALEPSLLLLRCLRFLQTPKSSLPSKSSSWKKAQLQNAYKKAGLKRWDLSKVTATWGTLSNHQGWQEDIALEAQASSSGSQKQLTSALGAIGKTALEPGQQRDPDFEDFTNQVTALASLKGKFFFVNDSCFMWLFLFPWSGGWEKEINKAQDIAARLSVRSADQPVQKKGKDLDQWCTDQTLEIGKLRAYLSAASEAQPGDFKPEHLPAAKAWVASTQENLTKAKAKVKSNQALV